MFVKKKNMVWYVCSFTFALIFILCSGCTHNWNGPVRNELTTENMHYRLESKPTDLSTNGSCPGTIPLKIVNAEKNEQQRVILKQFGHTHYIMPKEFVNLAKDHLEARLIESKLQIDSSKGKEILLSFEDLEFIQHFATLEATVKLKVQIPELNYSQIYSGNENSGTGFLAIAYGVHLAMDKLLDDPVFQKYVNCQ